MEYNPFLFLFHCKQVCLLHLLHFGGRSKSEYSVVVAAFFSSLKHLPRYHWRNNCALGQVSIILTRWFHGIWKYAFFLPWAVNFDPFHIVQVRLLYLPPQKKKIIIIIIIIISAGWFHFTWCFTEWYYLKCESLTVHRACRWPRHVFPFWNTPHGQVSCQVQELNCYKKITLQTQHTYQIHVYM